MGTPCYRGPFWGAACFSKPRRGLFAFYRSAHYRERDIFRRPLLLAANSSNNTIFMVQVLCTWGTAWWPSFLVRLAARPTWTLDQQSVGHRPRAVKLNANQLRRRRRTAGTAVGCRRLD